ncbi:HEAT repeat domain-containing protein [Fodinicurvata halophila]|uniref:HEAT repeat domain-containing protein n=1 Tax=Fodinicurvata halophila TaxID=1419723 RepID=A0ABV8UGE3_9PROT
MGFLQILWVVSLALSTLALAAMLSLVLRRLLIQRLEARRRRIRKDLLQDVFSYLEGNLAAQEMGQRAAAGRSVLTELIHELAQLVRGNELARLMALFEDLGLSERILHDLKHGDRHRRLLAAKNLGHAETDKGLQALREALEDSDPDVRLAAVSSLTELGAAPSLELLIDKLKIGSSEQSRALLQIFQGLAETRCEEMTACLEKEDTDEVTRILILDALGKSGQYQAVPHIMQATSSPSLEVRAAALRALADLQHPAASRAVLQALSDADWEVRTQAASCAGRLGLNQALEPLAALLDDSNWWTRYRAAEALHALGKQGRHRLSEAANNGEERARRIASMILAEKAVP